MNILIVNGSPRKTGLISQMLDIMREDAESRGDKVQMVYSNDLSIKPCIGCMACRTKLKCSVYGMMRDTPRFPEPLMKGKKCILLSTCTTPWPWNIWFKQSRGAIRAMREICRYSGIKIVATIERGGTAMHPQLSEKDKQKCHKSIRKI